MCDVDGGLCYVLVLGLPLRLGLRLIIACGLGSTCNIIAFRLLDCCLLLVLVCAVCLFIVVCRVYFVLIAF